MGKASAPEIHAARSAAGTGPDAGTGVAVSAYAAEARMRAADRALPKKIQPTGLAGRRVATTPPTVE